jgi:hypothetical protein
VLIRLRYSALVNQCNQLSLNAFERGHFRPEGAAIYQPRAERSRRGDEAPPWVHEYTDTKPCKGDTEKRDIMSPLQGSGDDSMSTQGDSNARKTRIAFALG